MSTFIKSINELTKMGNYPSPKHPLMALVKIEHVRDRKELISEQISFGFYTIGLKKNLKGYLKYGRRNYDFQEGVLVFTAPKQIISYENLIVDESEGWYLFFDKSILSNHGLAKHFDQYKFFTYQVDEALHLSKDEEVHISSIFESLYTEYNKPIDFLSKPLLVNHLEMICLYAERYYKRQFITRKEVETDFLIKFEGILLHICSLENLKISGIPSVKIIAEEMCLSPNYLSDALRNLTGMGIQRHIHLRLIELAKEQLLVNHHTISDVAYNLGFESPNYFARIFKKFEGITPTAYRNLN